MIRMLTCLIEKALIDNRELKVLNEDVQIAGNEVLARSGAYLPFISLASGAGLERVSRFTIEGAGLLDDPYLPGKFFPNPHGNFGDGLNLSWQLDIYRQLRNARDAAGAALRRRQREAELLRDPPGRRRRRELLPAHGAGQAAREPGPDHRAPGAEPRGRQAQQGIRPRQPSWPSCGSRPRSRGTRARS